MDDDYIRKHWGLLNLNCETCRDFEEINGFRSISEFERFLKYIGDGIKGIALTEIPVEVRYTGFQNSGLGVTSVIRYGD